jgi:FKBP-type peptidyl-prolyl cis-trans isomerase FklB
MRKQIIAVLITLASGAVLCGTSLAQQAPPTSAQQSSAAAPQKPAAAKPAQASSAKKPVTTAPALATDRDKESYALGMNVAKGLQQRMKEQSVDVDNTLLLRGIKDGLSGAKTLLTDDEATAALTKLQADVRQKQEEQRKLLGDKNLKEGEAFLAANKAKDGVVTSPSGLQYKVLTQGTGPKPAATDMVVCQYRGTLLDGTEFDSSYKRGQPATFQLNRVIKGWTEALQLMPVGSKWQIVIPPDLAYGDRGAPGSPIGPNATLIFEVELMKIQTPGQGQDQNPNQQPNQNK